MPTNDERREVAARLRDMAPGSDWPNYVAEACGMDVSKMSNNFHTFTEQLCLRLAALIEPEERTCRIRLTDTIDTLGQRMYQCSSCGYLTEVEVCFSGDGVEIEGFSFCPNCGAKVVEE